MLSALAPAMGRDRVRARSASPRGIRADGVARGRGDSLSGGRQRGATSGPALGREQRVREDPKKQGLLYAGTETGVYVSFNDGADWRPLQLNLPTAPIHDLVVKNDDLVLATHGRSFWILDDVTPLRQFTDEVAKNEVYLYKTATAYRVHNVDIQDVPKPILVGQNPPPGAVIYYYLKQAPKGETTIEILDAAGNMIRKYSSNKMEPLEEPLDPDDKKPEKQVKAEAGLNRFLWDLRYEGASRVPDYYLFEYKDGARGPLAVPGQYQVRLTVDGKSQATPSLYSNK